MSDQSSALLNSLQYIMAGTLGEISAFLPRLAAALAVLILGAALARVVKRIVVRVTETLRFSSLLKNTPIEHFVTNTEMTEKVEEILGSIVYWLLMLLVVHSSVTILGLTTLSAVLDRVLGYIPHVISAVVVVFFGLLMAGVVESLVKASIKSIDGHSARLLGKVASYLVVTITILAAISELGIAQDFIMVMFMGAVATFSLGVGLAIGLGGQDLVRKLLGEWYERTLKDVSKK
jgi:hypothetical protein